MSRKGENIYKRKDGRWEGRYIKSHINGKAKYGYVYAKKYSDVKLKLNLAIAENKSHIKRPNNDLLFKDVCQNWLCVAKVNCKINTYNKYRNICENRLLKTFGNYAISNIDSCFIDSYIYELLTNGKLCGGPLAKKSVQDILLILKEILIFGRDSYGATLSFPLGKLKVSQEKKELRVLNDVEISILYNYLKEDMDLCKLGIMISLFTGLRIGELCALTWGDIFLEDRLLRVNKTAQRVQQLDSTSERTKLIIATPKSNASNRLIPIPIELIKYIEQFTSNESHFILSNSSKCVEPRLMQYRFNKIAKCCNIKNVSFHTLRHTFATRCIQKGFDPKTLSEILGHANVSITLNRYVHSSIEFKRELMDTII